MDMIEIERAEVREGGVMLDTKLHVPDDVRDGLRAILRSKTDAAANAVGEGGVP